MMLKPILIAGPTASGKSALALALAKDHPSVIINADALQVYDTWRVLTARPNEKEEAQAPHALYGHVPLRAAYSTGHWLRDCKAALEAHRDVRPIIVGGTGLYFGALTQGLAEIPLTPPEIRLQANALMAEHGIAYFQTDLAARDAVSFAKLDQNNPMRLQRAWEVLEATGRGIAAWQAVTPPPLLPLNHVTALKMVPDVDWLNARIAARFDLMLDQGALAEAKAVRDSGLTPDAPSYKALGGPELIAHLNGTMSLNDAREAAIIGTRQFAKRQRTWFRNRMKNWHPLQLGPGITPTGLRAQMPAGYTD